ncbi:MAG: hypothetical protein H8M99_16190 [Gloeobacteraceae cyanobacterium ES-bin-144]|nr:hypothetical protein [Verrucomicrobiales bacterium]
MNTKPGEEKLALWLEDELHGEEFTAVETWATDHPEKLAARAEIRRWRELIASSVPASDEPPYADFFNSRIMSAIRHPVSKEVPVLKKQNSWRTWFMPLAASFGMALAFWLGSHRQQGSPEIDVAGAPKAIPVEPILYTPDNGVKAHLFNSVGAAATVIVLDGVAAIPDSTDFSSTAMWREKHEADATAGLEINSNQNTEP